MKILILGGTAEARALAARLVELGHEVTSSLAGRTTDPLPVRGAVRVGKFGGVAGLASYLKAGGYARLVDATHPYAGLISANAVAASGLAGVPLVRFMRPGWLEPEDAGWLHVPDIIAAAKALPTGATALITTGHEGLEAFLARDDCRLVVRLIEPPHLPLPPRAGLLLDRPPYGLEGEVALFRREGITCLVTKNSGGAQTAAKLEAARLAGASVVMVDRPSYARAREAETIADAIAALHLEASG
jgi:precorrin-6A/cobalt-precorrin-6A reductase